MINMKSIDFGYFNRSTGLVEGRLTTPKLLRNWSLLGEGDEIKVYKVLPWQEMRIDLVINEIYGDDEISMEATDVILHLNDIDNPLNIKAGMLIYYPSDVNNIDNFRYVEANFKGEVDPVRERVGKVVNKKTKVDSNRKAYVENNYALPPTVNKSPIPPVRIEEGKLVAGGVK